MLSENGANVAPQVYSPSLIVSLSRALVSLDVLGTATLATAAATLATAVATLAIAAASVGTCCGAATRRSFLVGE